MKKLQVNIPKEGQWGTIKTKYPSSSDLVSYDELTNESKNFETVSNGSAVKRLGGVNYNSSTFTGAPKDQYEAIFSDGVHHLLEASNGTLRYSSGGGTFTDVTSGYSTIGNFEFSIYSDRVYFGNGIDSPQVYDRTTTYGGVGYSAPQTKVMGAQAPSSAPTVAVAAGGNVPVGAHTYKITYLYYDFEESNGGTASGVATTTAGNQTVNLTSIPIGGYGVTARKIYRDNNDGDYLLVGTIANNTATTFSDTVSTGTSPIPLTNNVPPSFKYIVTHLDRNWLAGVPGDPSAVYLSEAGLPDIFPGANRILCNPRDPITALYVYNDTVWVLNRNSLGKIIGRTKDTFRYSEIPSSVGCVDNRSVQIITNTGIPTLVWLSDKGMYGSNGSSVDYLSDAIEDLVNLNIQQASQVKGQNAQTSQSQFDAGTKSPAITTAFGTISVANPTRTWDDETDWEGGSSLTNVGTNLNNQLRVPTLHAPLFSEGTHSNTVEISSTLRTAITSDFTGESNSGSIIGPNVTARGVAYSFIPPRTGTLSSYTLWINVIAGGSVTMRVWNDLAGIPGTSLHSQGQSIASGGSNVTINPGIVLTGGQRYWIGCDGASNQMITANFTFSTGGSNKIYNNVTWVNMTGTNLGGSQSGSYAFSQTAVATSGMWTGPSYDSYSDSAVAASVTHTGTYPAGTSGTTTIEASNVSDFSSGVTTQSFSNANGTSVVTLTNKRYWRIKFALTSGDDRVTAQIGLPTFKFTTTATWISEAIDHTTDITALSSLTMSSSTPAGTTATIEVATSADNITYPDGFVAVGSAVVRRYSKVRITLTSTGDNATTPTVTSATLNWAVSANLISSAIDTGATPAGWDIFQSQFATNGGTVTFHFRSATTLGGLTAASFVAVTNGAFPTTAVNQFAQWRATLTATANNVPTVDSVTVNWFISNVSSIRVASLFYNRSYYLAAAEYNQTANNLMIKLDANGMWRVYRGISASTMGMFFNDPYYGSSTEGRLIRFLQGFTDQGIPIEMIIDTKSMDFGDDIHTKILKKVYLSAVGTGGVYQVQFSLDEGTTFHDMIDIQTGLSTYTSTNDGTGFTRRFQPNFDIGQPTASKTIMIRVKEATAASAEVSQIMAEVLVRTGDII